ncbi:Protein of unknown function [Marivirga sericea]|uniref:Putative auto-transporter adhesin head GIN domain-containing protein n=1 Tax=Marivirga sericea TaxID=1028 RepID=A0A1X7L093_9BACT|nr:DUF2807 domain-containing protein [Marivirga sericea]SMG46873.1 Protein of unknown function [Marivirga sericea]
MKKVLLLIITFYLSTAYCVAQDSPSLEKDEVVKEIALPSFNTVAVKGGGDYYFHYSSNTKVEIKGADSCVESIGVIVSSKILSLNPLGGFSENCRVEIHIFMPNIREIQQNGGGRIVVNEGFAPVDKFKCTLDGGGILIMTSLKVDSLLAFIEGGGEISARVNKKIHGKIRAGGVISYQGDPLIETDIVGGGTIKRK